MRAGFGQELCERLGRVDVAARQMLEIVAISAESVKQTAADWNLADSLAGLTVFEDGAVKLQDTAFTAFDQATITGGSYDTFLRRVDPVVAVIDWGGAQSQAVELQSLTARLAPNVSGGGQEVQQWMLQLFNLMDERPEGKLTNPVIELVPIMAPLAKTAVTSEGDVIFDFAGMLNKPRPKSIYPPPQGAHATANPITFVMIWGLKADGTPAGNIGWARWTGASSYTSGGNRLTHANLTQSKASFIAKPGSNWFRYDELSSNVPRLKVVWNTGTAATITFTTELCDLLATPTDTVEFTGTGETPAGSGLTYAVQADDATWLDFLDGQTTDDLTAENPTHPITKRATYAVRASLSPTLAGDGTPTLRTLGVRALAIYDCSQVAQLSGGGTRIDPATLKASIAEPTLTAIKDGEADFRDLISEVLSSFYLGQLSVRVFWGAEDLPRGAWMHYDTYLVDDYDDAGGGVTLSLLSVLVLLRGVLPPFNPATLLREPVTTTQSTTIAAAWAEIMDGQLGLPIRYRGEGPTDTATVSKVIPSNVQSPHARAGSIVAQLQDQQGWQTVQAKDQIDGLSFIAGGATIASQGRIKWVPIAVGDVITRPDASLGFAITQIDAPRVWFHEGEVQWVQVTPGFAERVPEYYAPYNWNVDVQKFGYEHRAYNAPGLLNLGVGRVSSQPTVLDTDTAQWLVSDGGTPELPTSSVARRVATRQATLLGTGMMLWRFRTTYAYPELEVGDTICVPTDRFVALNPIGGGSIVGRLTANAVIVETNPNGKDFGVWIRQWSDLAPSLQDVTGLGVNRILVVAASTFVPLSYAATWSLTNGYAQCSAVPSTPQFRAPIDPTQLPQGARLAEVRSRVYIGTIGGASASNSANMILTAWPIDGSAGIGLATIVADSGMPGGSGAWVLRVADTYGGGSATDTDHVVDWTLYTYTLSVALGAVNDASNARFMAAEIEWKP